MKTLARALVLLLLLASSARAQEDGAFKDDLELLKAEMRLKALSELHERGFYVPLSVFREYNEAHRELLAKTHGLQTKDLEIDRAWADEEKKVSKAESDELGKIIEKYGKKLLKQAAKAQDEVRKFGLPMRCVLRPSALRCPFCHDELDGPSWSCERFSAVLVELLR